MLLFVIYEWNQAKKLISDRKFWELCGIVLITAIVGLFLMKDNEIMIAFMDNMGKGGGILNNVRFEAQRLALKQLFDHDITANYDCNMFFEKNSETLFFS